MKKTVILLSIILIELYSCNYKEKKEKAEYEAGVIKSTLIKVGQIVPEFSYITLNNNMLNIEGIKGKVVFMNFFATSCPICIKELPLIKMVFGLNIRMMKIFKLIVFGREHVADEMIAFKEKNGYTFNIVPDPGRNIYSLFAEMYIPRNVVLDREGKIIYQVTGFNDEEFTKLKNIIEKELNK